MNLIQNWREILNKAWGVRVALFTAFLAVADQVLALFNYALPPATYALLSAAIIVSRVLYQSNVSTSVPAVPAPAIPAA